MRSNRKAWEGDGTGGPLCCLGFGGAWPCRELVDVGLLAFVSFEPIMGELPWPLLVVCCEVLFLSAGLSSGVEVAFFGG